MELGQRVGECVIDIRYIRDNDVANLGDVLKPLIEPALNGAYTVEDVLDRLENGDWRAFCVVEDNEVVACATVRIAEWPQIRTLFVITLGGRDMDRWLDDLIEILRRYAREMGCDMLLCSCRPGMAKVLKNRNWRHHVTTMGLAIDG